VLHALLTSSATQAVASFTFISPVSSSIVAPATQKISESFGITNFAVSQISYSVFVLGYAFGPLFLSPLSEIYGRSKLLQLANLFYLVFNTVAGFSRNTGELIAFRFLSGLGGSAPLAVRSLSTLVPKKMLIMIGWRRCSRRCLAC
jgi:MFS family permease